MKVDTTTVLLIGVLGVLVYIATRPPPAPVVIQSGGGGGGGLIGEGLKLVGGLF